MQLYGETLMLLYPEEIEDRLATKHVAGPRAAAVAPRCRLLDIRWHWQ
jgi:hypothetical protein